MNRHQRRYAQKQPLYQVCVEDRSGKLVQVGPKAGRQFCEVLLYQINKQIIAGHEKVWSNPHVLLADKETV